MMIGKGDISEKFWRVLGLHKELFTIFVAEKQKKMIRRLYLSLWVCFFGMASDAQVVINDLMQSDDDGIAPAKAIISLIDDDTLQPADVEALHQACVDNGIVATFACITSRGKYYPNLFDLLHSCEDDGFQVVLHCNEQKNYYRWSQNLDMTVSGATHVTVGAKYTYSVGTRVCPVTVEEVHLDAEGNGHIYFDYMQRWYPVPETQTGELSLSSGNSDAVIAYSGFQVREFRDKALVNADMDMALDILANEGFKDYEYFVAPYGSQDVGLQEIAQNHELKCLVSISNDDYLRNDSQYTPYNIPRVSFNATDGGTSTMSRLKEHIDSVSVTGGWLLVGTHIYNGWTDALLKTRFKEFVDYAKSKGLQFVTLKDGFEIYSTTSGNQHFSPLPTDVDHLAHDAAGESFGECYDILGCRREKPKRGLNIMRKSDGTIRKLFLR